MCEEIDFFLSCMLKLIILVQCVINKAKLSSQKLNFDPALIVLQINTYQFFMEALFKIIVLMKALILDHAYSAN